jgi:hypothetical protein
LRAKSSASNRSTASVFASTRSAFHAFSPRFVRGSKTTGSYLGYAFGFATMAFLVLQKLAQAFCIRLRRTYNS